MKKFIQKVKSVLTWFMLITYPLIAVFAYMVMYAVFFAD